MRTRSQKPKVAQKTAAKIAATPVQALMPMTPEQMLIATLVARPKAQRPAKTKAAATPMQKAPKAPQAKTTAGVKMSKAALLMLKADSLTQAAAQINCP